jgi:hypothetical protein
MTRINNLLLHYLDDADPAKDQVVLMDESTGVEAPFPPSEIPELMSALRGMALTGADAISWRGVDIPRDAAAHVAYALGGFSYKAYQRGSATTTEGPTS